MNEDTAQVVLADSGRLTARIQLPANPSPVEEFAAEELRRHLHEMAGLGPQYRAAAATRASRSTNTIYLNDVKAAEKAGVATDKLELGAESYHLETRGGDLYILGGGQRGLLYGVYDLLETLGWRWYTPEIRRVPHVKKVVVPAIKRTAKPAFEFRDMWVWDCHDPLWWVRNRMNGWYTKVPEFMGGHNDYCGFVHTFYGLLPPAEFFEKHPEYFSEVDGVRKREGAQLCLSNPDVIKIVTQRVIDLMKKNPNMTIFSVSQNDSYGFCECPACKAIADEEGSQSGPMIHFVNAVAAETSKLFPNKLIDTLAYQYTLDAPAKVVPHANVRVRLCSIGCCQGHAYGTCNHKESARFMKAFDAWGKRTKQMYIWHYATNFSNYLMAMPDFDELNANLKLYKSRGVHGIFVQGMGEEGGGGESMALRGYVLSKLLWNPDQDVWALVDEWLGAVFGAAAPKVREYMNVFHDRVRADRELHPSLYDPPAHRLFNEELLAPADAALAEAEKLAKGDAHKRVRLLRSGIAYARFARKQGNFKIEGDLYKGQGSDEELARLNELIKEWKKMGILRLREGENFEAGVYRLRMGLGSRKVEWLSDGDQKIAVIPSMGGRIHEWHVSGRQWLAAPQIDGTPEGYGEFITPGSHGLRETVDEYKAKRKDNELVLSTVMDAVLQVKRVYSLAGGVLRIRTILENRGDRPVLYTWGAGMHLLTGSDVSIIYTDSSGEKRLKWNELHDGLVAARLLAKAEMPVESWHVETSGFRISHKFGEGVTKAIVGKVESRGMLALDIRSATVEIQPGKKVKFEQEWKCLQQKT